MNAEDKSRNAQILTYAAIAMLLSIAQKSHIIFNILHYLIEQTAFFPLWYAMLLIVLLECIVLLE